MTKDELIQRLKECDTGDTELDHVRSDELLLDYINDPEVTKAFIEIDKWYA